tara:strand:+ start:80 stop:232 length:153 start_codon:yes stop_codon:yes gene_type:complete
MRKLIMLSLFQGCLGLSFKNWTGLLDCRIYRIDFLGLNRGLFGQEGRIVK